MPRRRFRRPTPQSVCAMRENEDIAELQSRSEAPLRRLTVLVELLRRLWQEILADLGTLRRSRSPG